MSDEQKARLTELAHALDFPVVGFTDATLSEEAKAHFHEWLAMGYHADMHYLETRRDMALGLSSVLAAAKSVVVLGLPYLPKPRFEPPPDAPYGRISHYARGRDYHRVFEKRLKKLVNLCREMGAEARAYVDYGPLPERYFAKKAGLGVIGKNGCLIHPIYGSYLFLGALITDLAIEPDRPSEEGCLNCGQCVEACPTGALRADGFLDAKRCISYQTIENKGDIPKEIARKMGRWLIGCDACQLVCPMNKKAKSAILEDFRSPRFPLRMPLRDIETLDKTSFFERFKGSAWMRPELSGIQRNARILQENQEKEK